MGSGLEHKKSALPRYRLSSAHWALKSIFTRRTGSQIYGHWWDFSSLFLCPEGAWDKNHVVFPLRPLRCEESRDLFRFYGFKWMKHDELLITCQQWAKDGLEMGCFLCDKQIMASIQLKFMSTLHPFMEISIFLLDARIPHMKRTQTKGKWVLSGFEATPLNNFALLFFFLLWRIQVLLHLSCHAVAGINVFCSSTRHLCHLFPPFFVALIEASL